MTRVDNPMHDLRTRLAETEARSNVLLKEFRAVLPPEDQERYREFVKERVERCAAISEAIMEYKRNVPPPSPPKPGWFKRLFG